MRVGPVGEFDGSLWKLNSHTDHLYAGAGGGILVLDADTLQPVGRIQKLANREASAVAVDPDRPLAYVAWQSRIGPKQTIVLTAFDTNTLVTVGSMELPFNADILGLALGPRPPASAALSAGVAGPTVTLSWTTTLGACDGDRRRSSRSDSPPVRRWCGYRSIAGATSLTVPGVPPGRYYVRVRSVNGTGLGTPSNEVLVEVP